MTDRIMVNAIGCAVSLDLSEISDEDAPEIEAAWSGARASDGDPLPAVHLTVAVNGDSTLPHALSNLSQKVTLAAIEARRGDLWMLHAAGLADERGRVVVLVGPSGQGKTTAARTLGAHYGYVTDETLAITPDGEVVPYRKPLSVIEESLAVKAQRSPDELGLHPLPRTTLRVAGIVILERRTEDEMPEALLENCDLGEVLPALVEQTSYIAELDAPLRMLAAIVDSAGGVHRAVYSEASTLVDAVSPLFDREPGRVTISDPLIGPRAVDDDSAIYRGAYIDALSLDEPDRVVLLQSEPGGGAMFRVVTGIGPALWRAADGVRGEDLVEAAISEYGQPDAVDIAKAVDTACEEMMTQSVLVGEPTWRVRSDVAVTGEGERFVAMSLMDLMNPTPMALEGSAAMIWDAIARSRGITASQLVTEIAGRVGLEPEAVSSEVLAFLGTLLDSALVERIAP